MDFKPHREEGLKNMTIVPEHDGKQNQETLNSTRFPARDKRLTSLSMLNFSVLWFMISDMRVRGMPNSSASSCCFLPLAVNTFSSSIINVERASIAAASSGGKPTSSNTLPQLFIISISSSYFFQSFFCKIDIFLAGFPGFFLKCVKHIQFVANVRDIQRPELTASVDPDFTNTGTNCFHRFPVKWLKTVLDTMQLKTEFFPCRIWKFPNALQAVAQKCDFFFRFHVSNCTEICTQCR